MSERVWLQEHNEDGDDGAVYDWPPGMPSPTELADAVVEYGEAHAALDRAMEGDTVDAFSDECTALVMRYRAAQERVVALYRQITEARERSANGDNPAAVDERRHESTD